MLHLPVWKGFNLILYSLFFNSFLIALHISKVFLKVLRNYRFCLEIHTQQMPRLNQTLG